MRRKTMSPRHWRACLERLHPMDTAGARAELARGSEPDTSWTTAEPNRAGSLRNTPESPRSTTRYRAIQLLLSGSSAGAMQSHTHKPITHRHNDLVMAQCAKPLVSRTFPQLNQHS